MLECNFARSMTYMHVHIFPEYFHLLPHKRIPHNVLFFKCKMIFMLRSKNTKWNLVLPFLMPQNVYILFCPLFITCCLLLFDIVNCYSIVFWDDMTAIQAWSQNHILFDSWELVATGHKFCPLHVLGLDMGQSKKSKYISLSFFSFFFNQCVT